MKIAATLEYDGTKFSGFQRQKNAITIQQHLEEALNKITNENIVINYSGRTDAGVHAIEQSAHFDLKNKLLNLDKFINSINHFLKNENIAILKIKKRNSNFHSRFSAKKRIYKYIILNRTSSPVIEKNQVWHVRKKLDLDLMKLGAKKLVGTKDFSTFRASSCNAKSPVRTMDFVKLKSSNDKIEIQFKSQSFLQQQVRSMVGCLKYLGEKKWDLKNFDKALKSKKRSMCAPPAPPNGLFLSRIFY